MILQISKMQQRYKDTRKATADKQEQAPVTSLIIVLCILAFPLSHFTLLLSYSQNAFTLQGRWWTLFTTIFVHGNWAHLGGNMFFLYFFGRALERMVGSALYTFIYIVGGVLSLYVSSRFYPAHEYVVGASGAISTVIATLMLFNPWRLSFFLTFIPMPLGVAGFTYLLLNLASTLHKNQGAVAQHVAYEVHIAGFLIGLVMGMLFSPNWRKNLIICIVLFIVFYAAAAYLFHVQFFGVLGQ